VDIAVGLGDDPVHGRQAEPCALSPRLGGEERLEHTLDHLWRHAVAHVADREPDVPAGLDLAVEIERVLVELDVGGREDQPASGRHRVARVHRQVDEYLFDLSGIGLDRPQPGRELRLELDVLAERAAQQAVELGRDVVEVEHHGPHDLVAAEDQQLPRQRRAALGRPPDLLHVIARGEPSASSSATN
jgi:hypothetical protein